MIRRADNSNRIVVGISIVILCAIFVLIRRSTSLTTPVEVLKTIPDFKISDYFGRMFESSYLYGKPSYVQFVDILNPADMEHLSLIYRNWKSENMNIVIISGAIDKIRAQFEITPSDRIILISDYKSAMKIFRANYIGKYYIFDAAGKLVITQNSNNYECQAKIVLKQVVRNEYFRIADWFDPNKTLSSINGLENVTENIIKENKEVAVLALFNRICDTCSGGHLVQKMNEIFNTKKSKIYICLMVNNKFSSNDVDNLRTYLNINYPVVIANGFFSQQWNRLINEYCDSELSDIILVIDKSGKIIHIADKKCNCYSQLFDYLIAL